MPDRQRAYWIEVGLLAIASALAYRIGMIRAAGLRPGLLLVFLLPIQFCWVRRGERAGLIASGLAVAVLFIWDLVEFLRFRASLAGEAGLMFVDLVPVVAFLGGLYLLNAATLTMRIRGEQRSLTVVHRMLGTVAIAAAVYVPVGIIVDRSGVIDGLTRDLAESLTAAFPTLVASEAEVLNLVSTAVQVSLSAFFVGFFATLLANWWIGTRLALRTRLLALESNPVADRLRAFEVGQFRLPTGLVWGAVAALGGIVLSLAVELGWFSFVLWNAALIVLALYAIQGLGVLWHFLDRRGAARRQRIAVAIGLAVGLLVPGLNLILLIGLPGLGISEVWVNYHRFERSGEEK